MENNEIIIDRDTKLTAELLAEFKKRYKKIYKTVLIDGTEIIWRRFNRNEYKELMLNKEMGTNGDERLWAREEECCRMVVLYPCREILDEIMEDMAGVATILSDDIYEQSGFRVSKRTEQI